MQNRPPLTVGDLRAAIADLPDDTPVRTAELADAIIEHQVVVQAVQDSLTVADGDLPEHQGRPYLLLDTRAETDDEHRAITDPAEEPRA